MNNPYYLHKVDTVLRGFVIIVNQKPQIESFHLEINGAPLMSGAEKFTVKTGWTLGPVPTQNEAEGIARAIAARYNWDIEIDGRLLGLTTDYIARRQAAAAMGAAKSSKKAAASRENGKKGGRPTKEQKARRRMDKLGFSEGQQDFIFTDWDNWDEHIDWLLTASREEIQSWGNATNWGA